MISLDDEDEQEESLSEPTFGLLEDEDWEATDEVEPTYPWEDSEEETLDDF